MQFLPRAEPSPVPNVFASQRLLEPSDAESMRAQFPSIFQRFWRVIVFQTLPRQRPASRMCGIVGIFNSNLKPEELRKLIVRLAKRLRHRGPDWSGVKVVEGGAIAHERLAIVDPESGSQPLTTDVPAGDASTFATAKITLAVNGEIYNHREIAGALSMPFAFKTRSDCECIPLYCTQRRALIFEKCTQPAQGNVRVHAARRARWLVHRRSRPYGYHSIIHWVGCRWQRAHRLRAESAC